MKNSSAATAPRPPKRSAAMARAECQSIESLAAGVERGETTAQAMLYDIVWARYAAQIVRSRRHDA